MKTLQIFAIVILALTISSFDHPKGWLKDGKVDKYDIKVLTSAGYGGKNTVTIKSLPVTTGHDGACIWQNSLPTKFMGHRVKMTAYLKTASLTDTAGVWFKIVNAPAQTLEIDERQITKTLDWTKFEIILDVPKGATNLNYGAYLSGLGQLWISEISFEIVDKTIKSTTQKSEAYVPVQGGPIDVMTMLPATHEVPTNLDFATTVKAD